MSGEAEDVDATVVLRIRVGKTTGQAHDVANMAVAQHGIGGAGSLAKLPEGFERRDAKKIGLADDVDSGEDGIERGLRLAREFSNSKISFTFIEAEANV